MVSDTYRPGSSSGARCAVARCARSATIMPVVTRIVPGSPGGIASAVGDGAPSVPGEVEGHFAGGIASAVGDGAPSVPGEVEGHFAGGIASAVGDGAPSVPGEVEGH